jgi:Domain of unknown function (DUF4326)
MNNGSSVVDRWQDTATLDRQPEDARSEAGVPVCRLALVKFPGDGQKTVSRTTLYLTGSLAERCRDGLSEGDVIEARGLKPVRQRSTARHPEVIVPDAAGAVRLRERAPQIADAASGARLPQCGARVVFCHDDDSYDVYIGRGRDPRSGEFGKFGNRYSHKPSRVPGVVQVATAQDAVDRYRSDLWAAIRRGTITLEQLAALHRKTLGCWCPSWEPCHGLVLASAAAWAAGQLAARQ